MILPGGCQNPRSRLIIGAMGYRKGFVTKIVVASVVFLAHSVNTPGADIKVWTARALATVLTEIGPEFERTTGHKLVVTSGLPNQFLKRFNDGEQFDILISGSTVVDEWIKSRRLIAQSRTDVARSGIGVEVRKGAPKPDISSVEAFKKALLNAKSIAYLKVGSGIYLDDLLERLGIAAALQTKVTRPDSDIVSELVAEGKIELGLVVITQILTTPGVELVGPLPLEIQSYVKFTAGISTNTNLSTEARRLIDFLKGSRAIPVIKKQGMEPVSD